MKFFLINPIALIFILLLGINNVQASSECYDHWNGDAWHGTGAWAMVMCLDTPKFISCQVRSHEDGSILKDLKPHIAQDQGRDIWTVYDYNITVPWINRVLDNGKHGSY